MNRFRLFPPALALLFAIGCAGEEGAETSPAPSPTPGPAPSAAPKIPDAPKPEAPAPAPEAKDEAAPAPTPPADEKAEEKKAEEKPSLEAPKADAGADALSDEEVANVKKLPDEADRKAALVQAICPVSDEHLGAMDTPIKVTAEGRTFFLCCKSCNDDVKSNPKAVLEKLDKLAKK